MAAYNSAQFLLRILYINLLVEYNTRSMS